MKVEIKVPAMGESISEATIGQIIKTSGSKVSMDDELLELETDKVNQVLSAPQAGILTLTVKPEDVVKIGQVVGFVDSEGTTSTTPSSQEKKKEEKLQIKEDAQPQSQASSESKTDKVSEKKIEQAAAPSPVQPTQKEEESARLTKEDFVKTLKPELKEKSNERAQTTVDSTAKIEATPKTEKPVRDISQPETRKKMSRIRKVIAQRLVEVKQTTAMLTTFNEVDMNEVIRIREKHRELFLKEHSVKLGFMSFFVKACVSALHAHPDVNSYIDGDDLVTRNTFDIGIAVGTDRGLVVPVVRGCDHLTFSQIESEIASYGKKAREGKLAVEDLVGGGFTITNGGVYGSLLSTPILNPPQSAILGMHKIMKRAVVVGDQIVIRSMMYLALSYDHRVIDGKEAVTFLIHIKDFLEDPTRLLLEN